MAAVFVLVQAPKASFGLEHKAQIQSIANTLCAAASEKACEVSWDGKNKWFGTLQPYTAGQGKVGLDHIRKALPKPHWQETEDANGVTFRNGQFEVFYSAQSGAIAISSMSSTRLR